MATSRISATEGSGKNIATHSFSEDSVTKELQRVVVSNSSGTDISPATSTNQTAQSTLIGAVDETAPASDTASSGLNGRLQRIAQRLTSLIALVPTALTGSGNFKTAIQEAIPAGTNNIGDVDVLSLPALAAGTNTIGKVNVLPETTGGLSIFRSIDLDEGTLEVVKNSAGQVYGMWVTNTATATRFIKFYDATSGTAGTGTPVITIGIPGNSSDDVSGLFASTHGIAFATGICVGATTGVADNDTGAPGANEVIINIFYK